MALAVADDDEVVVEDRDVVGQIEFPVVGTGFAPRHDVVAFRVHSVHT